MCPHGQAGGKGLSQCGHSTDKEVDAWRVFADVFYGGPLSLNMPAFGAFFSLPLTWLIFKVSSAFVQLYPPVFCFAFFFIVRTIASPILPIVLLNMLLYRMICLKKVVG